MMNHWPSILSPEELQSDQMYSWLKNLSKNNADESQLQELGLKTEMPPETFYQYIDEMRQFMQIVLKICFNHFYYHKQVPEASSLFESLVPQKKRAGKVQEH